MSVQSFNIQTPALCTLLLKRDWALRGLRAVILHHCLPKVKFQYICIPFRSYLNLCICRILILM
uniref:Uncharacterized protein n=1 Tax=Anguilla anguilla TaxID=7936 RepID=A0A0E9XNH5_ANGAN